MSFLSLLIGPLSSLIDKIFTNETDKRDAKAELMSMMLESQAKEFEAKGNIIVAEAQGESWLQRNWRPLLMLIFIILIANNYILVPYLAALGLPVQILALPGEMWTLLTVGVGGYIGGRSAEKVADKFNEQKFYHSLRNQVGGLTQEQVDAFNKALSDAKK